MAAFFEIVVAYARPLLQESINKNKKATKKAKPKRPMYARRVSLSIAPSMPVGHCGTLVIAIGKKKRKSKQAQEKSGCETEHRAERIATAAGAIERSRPVAGCTAGSKWTVNPWKIATLKIGVSQDSFACLYTYTQTGNESVNRNKESYTVTATEEKKASKVVAVSRVSDRELRFFSSLISFFFLLLFFVSLNSGTEQRKRTKKTKKRPALSKTRSFA